MSRILNITLCLVVILFSHTFAQFTVAFWGDSRSNTNNAFSEIAGFIKNHRDNPIDVHWQNGDFTHEGTAENWARSWSFANVKEACIKDYFFMCASNHDNNPTQYTINMKNILPDNGSNCFYYHKQWDIPKSRRKVHLFSVDLHMSTASEQVTYFENILKTIPETDWICALWHDPTYDGMSYKATHVVAKNTFVPLFARYGGDLVLNGHAHIYCRTHLIDSTGGVAQQMGGNNQTSNSTTSEDNGMVHLINGRGGIFHTFPFANPGWPGRAFAPPLSDTKGLISYLVFNDNVADLNTFVVNDDQSQGYTIDRWTWTRGEPMPDEVTGILAEENSLPEGKTVLNTFVSKDEISIQTSHPSKIAIYNLSGTRVFESSGKVTRIIWDRQDLSGTSIPNGMYVIHFTNGTNLLSKNMVILD